MRAAATATLVRVHIENTYSCGRESDAHVELPPPPAGSGQSEIEAWFDDVVHDHTGDGHPCGSSEHALYEATIVAAPADRLELVGETYSWEG